MPKYLDESALKSDLCNSVLSEQIKETKNETHPDGISLCFTPQFNDINFKYTCTLDSDGRRTEIPMLFCKNEYSLLGQQKTDLDKSHSMKCSHVRTTNNDGGSDFKGPCETRIFIKSVRKI